MSSDTSALIEDSNITTQTEHTGIKRALIDITSGTVGGIGLVLVG